MTADLGVNCDKLGQSVSADDLQWLGSQWARVVADPKHPMQQLAYVRSIKQAGVKVLMVFDNDAYRHFGPLDEPSTWRQAANWGKVVFGPDLIDADEPTNEPDGDGSESSTMAITTVNGCIEAHRDMWGSEMTIVGVGSITGQVGYYKNVRTDLLDGCSLHPYAKSTPAALNKIIDQHAALGLPLWISEVGLDAPDDEQAAFMTWTLETIMNRPEVKVCTWFCAHQYGLWGMKREDGSWRPSADVFRSATTVTTDEPVFQLGFAKWAAIEGELLGKPLKNERNTGFPGWQIQPTSTGVLQWHEGDGHIFVTHDGRVFRWEESWPQSEEVAA